LFVVLGNSGQPKPRKRSEGALDATTMSLLLLALPIAIMRVIP
jgi:hypothetical protein